ncbi:MAG: hypothetical protein HQL71_02540 [Magnetococcales bacterium]|nr:hypothetical protein [Magnetococcales bacterium]
MIYQNETDNLKQSSVNLMGNSTPFTEQQSCIRCKRDLVPGSNEEICDSCIKVLQVLKQVMPGKKQQLTKKKISCPDCNGEKGHYMNPPSSCCGQGCCYVVCKTCSGSGKIRP